MIMTDKEAMKRALELALRGSGYVSPNPRVGAVILKEGKIISEGYHKKFGGPHGEVEAVNNAAGIDLEGATMVVNLEPCSHVGKTPACAPMLAEKKFARVVVGMQDPNPLVAGKGIEMLRDAGIEVVTGVLEEDCKWVNRFFIKHITTGIPYVIVKVAQSIDGCIATFGGDSKWITSEESRRRVHKLRAELDAVLVGRKTAEKDNPELTVRFVKGRDPKRIILDSNLSLPLGLKVFTDDNRKNTIICCKKEALESGKAKNLKIGGMNLFPFSTDEKGETDLKETLIALSKEYNIASILVEGGAKVYSSFAGSGLIDELHLFTAPIIIGNGISSFNSFHSFFVKDATQFRIKAMMKSDVDFQVIAVRKINGAE